MTNNRLSLDDLDNVSGGMVQANFYGDKQGITGFSITAPKNNLDEYTNLTKDADRIYAAIDNVVGKRGIEGFGSTPYALLCDETVATLKNSVSKMTNSADKAYGEKLLAYCQESFPTNS